MYKNTHAQTQTHTLFICQAFWEGDFWLVLQHTATHCNILRHTATRCDKNIPARCAQKGTYTGWLVAATFGIWGMCLGHDAFICGYSTWFIHVCVGHDSFTCVCETWLIHACGTRHIHKCVRDMNHSRVCVRHDVFTCVCGTWHIHVWVWDMTHLRVCVGHDAFTCVCGTWRI